MATGSDPELKDGFSIPVWMKTKPARDFDFAASPPPQEDSFFIRYPQTDLLFGKTKTDPNFAKIASESTEFTAANALPPVKDKDWSKHTKPCQDVLHSIAPISTAVKAANIKPKPAGTDDGFKGEGAACGNSVVKVAHQMVSSSRGFAVAGVEEEAEELAVAARQTRGRRGSRSLPASPAHSPPASPTTRRRHANRYFSSPYEPAEGAVGGWLAQALLGYKKDLASSTQTLHEEPLEHRLQGVSLAESVESLGPAPMARDPKLNVDLPSQPAKPKSSPTFRPKPTELREMNFWSPTSM